MDAEKIKNKEETNHETINSELIDFQHLPKKHKPFSSFTIFSFVFGIIILICFYLYFTFNYVFPINTALQVGNIKITNDTYNLVKTTLEKENPEVTNELVNIFLSDTIILSEKAKEFGINAEKSEYEHLVNKYGAMAERMFLREKLEQYLNKNATVTEEEMRNFYENNKKDYYVIDSKFKYYAVQSDSPMPSNYTPDINEELQLKEGTLKQLRAYGIYEPSKGIFPLDSTDGTYRYIIIVEGEMEYIPYEQIKENIKNAIYIQKTEGQISKFLEEGRTVYDIKYFK